MPVKRERPSSLQGRTKLQSRCKDISDNLIAILDTRKRIKDFCFGREPVAKFPFSRGDFTASRQVAALTSRQFEFHFYLDVESFRNCFKNEARRIKMKIMTSGTAKPAV
jgi:hypothetical protein